MEVAVLLVRRRVGPYRPLRAALAAFLALAAGAGVASAQRLDKPRQAWLAAYRLLALPDEVQVLRRLANPADLAEFERIFWARRNPDPSAAENVFRTAVEKARATADARFSESGKKGSETACGQVLMLVGNPDEISGREIRSTFQSRAGNATRDGARRPETWVYKSNASRTFRMPGGDLRLQFDDGCEFDEAGRTMDELARVSGLRVLHPELGYQFESNGRLRPLAVAAPARAGRESPLEQPRADFPLAFDVLLQVPGTGGGYTAGLVRGQPGSMPPTSIQPGKPLTLRVQARATSAAGPPVEIAPREIAAVARADGSFVTSYGLLLPAGRYDVTVAVREAAGGRGASATVPLDVPDYASGALIVGPLMVLAGASDGAGAGEGVDPYAAFITAGEHLFPRVANIFSTGDGLRLQVLVHGARVAPDSRKASLRARFSVSKDGKVVARGSEQSFDVADAAPSVGPIPLAPFGPGRYLARVEIDDDVAGSHLSREAAFEVRAPGQVPQP